MALFMLVIGLLLIVTGAMNTYAQFGSELLSEFTGQNNFLYWAVAVVMVGSIGYIPALARVSYLLMSLVVLSLFLSHRGFFAQFNRAISQGARAS